VLLGVHNGAALRRLDGSMLYRETLGAADVRRACALGKAQGGFPWVYVDEPDNGNSRIFCEEAASAPTGVRPFATTYYARHTQYFRVQGDLTDDLDSDAIEVMITTTAADADAMVATLAKEFGERASVIKEISSGVAQIEVAHPKVSKALALRFLAERDGIPAHEIMAIGDNFNDIDMLEYAGHPVVMGNAHEELRHMGYHVAPTNDEDGLAVVLAEVR
jgi:hydroxymethylpyrimidine pyrophosphatase-like HAD family hydrolase